MPKVLAAAVGVAVAHATLALGVRTLPDCTSEPLASNGICDTTASPGERAAALVAAMNQAEKLNNLMRSVQPCPRVTRVEVREKY